MTRTKWLSRLAIAGLTRVTVEADNGTDLKRYGRHPPDSGRR